MGIFCVYIVKSSVCLALFYLFYRLLLSRETFHRFNRRALLGVLFLSVLIPCIEVQVQHPADLQQAMYALGQLSAEVASVPTADFSASSVDTSVWLVAGCMLVYLLGGVFFLLRNLYSLYRLRHLFRACRQESLAGYLPDCPARVQLRVYEGELSPFSWLHYIFISRADLQENGREILIHELAHIRLRHSWDLLLADCCIFLQWFNPAAWLLKQELQAIHEYQADETVIHAGVNARQYQLLIIKKAVGTRLYSMANSLNHSSLKKRITMMMKEKSNPWARLKYLYVLPVAAMTLTAFARPEVSSVMNEISSDKVNDLVALMKEKIVEKADTVAPVYVSAEVSAKLKGTVFEMVEEMPEFPDGGMAGLMKYLEANIRYPESAKKAGKQGRVIVQFVVCKDGSITNVGTLRGIDPALDAEAIRVISAIPKWKPGRQRGKEVDVKYTVPVMFRLPDGKEKSVEKADMVAPVSVPAEVSAKLKGTVFEVVEEMPEFPDGGMAGLMKYLEANIRYPESAKKAGKQGRVIVQFVVCKDGSITNVGTLRGIDPALDAEAIRVISAIPKWKPGRQRGKEVDVKYTVPVMFRLPDGKEKSVEKADMVAPVSVPAEVSAKLKGTVFAVVEEMPEFPDGGTAGLMKYLEANIRYPESAKKAGKQGRVTVQFVVCKDGSITNVSTLRGIDPALDAEAIRVISAMPKWKPGRQRGKEVDVKYMVPVMFRLPDGSQSSSSKAADDGNKPLVLVDGREYTEELSKLPSSSIAFMKVLLGDEGVAQYGEKARHGVIKVTLKKAGSQSAAQEEVQVKGRVTDPSGQPVIGAVVQISGSKNGTVTDVDGLFQLIAPRDAMLEVAYIGMARAQVKVQPELTVILKEDKKK